MINKVLFIPYRIESGDILFFVGRRPDSGIWQFPTGHVGDNIKEEGIVDAAKRETLEELGIKSFKNFINTKSHFDWTKNKTEKVKEYIFAIDVTNKKIRLEKAEFSSYKFVGFNSLKDILTFESHLEIAKDLYKIIDTKKYPKIFIICGPGGSGKEAVLTDLQNATNLKRARTVTTRSMRPGESELGRKFVSVNEFEKLDKQNGLIEKNFFWGNWYGSIRKDIECEIEKANDVLIELDLNGVESFKKIYSNVVAIFLTVDIKKLEQRMKRRGGEDTARIEERMRIAREEIERSEICDYVIENKEGELERTVKKIENIIKNERRGERHGKKK